MQVFSNREVYLFGIEQADGVHAKAIWLKTSSVAGTSQELWSNKQIHSTVEIPKETTQIHTDIFLPYATVTTPLAATTNHA